MIRKPIEELVSVVWGTVSEFVHVRTQGMAGKSFSSFAGSSTFCVSCTGGDSALAGASCEEELSFARGGFTNL